MKALRTALAALPILLASLPARGQNLIVNPNFAGSLTGWTVNFATFDGSLSATADGTGSALTSWTLPKGASSGIANTMTQCVAGIVPGTNYFFGGKVLIPDQSGAGGGEVAIQWYSTSICTGFITNAQTPTAIVPGDATNVWHSLDANSIAPSGAASVLVIAAVLNNSGEGNAFSMNYDEIYLQTTPHVQPATVPVAGLPALIVLGLALAAAGVIRFSRIS